MLRQNETLLAAGMPKLRHWRDCFIVVCCFLLVGGCGREQQQISGLGEETVEQIELETVTNMHPVRAVVVYRFTKQVSLDEHMRASLKTSTTSIWVGAIDLKRSDGVPFRIVRTDAGITERAFISELVVGKSYQLPDDFVTLLQKKGWTNWVQAQLGGL